MAKMTISRQLSELEPDKKLVHYVQNGAVIGYARQTNGFAMEDIEVFRDGAPNLSLRETDRWFWVCWRWLLWFSLLVQMFFSTRYKVFEGEEMVGGSLEPRTRSAMTFRIRQDEYRLFFHAGNRFSLTKNGVQTALYAKRPEGSARRAAPDWPAHTYDVLYETGEQADVVRLFCLFIDKRFFLHYNYGGRSHQKYLVPLDPYSCHTLWTPDK